MRAVTHSRTRILITVPARRDLYTQGSCRYVDGLPDDNCRFVPDDQQTANSSLMSFTILESVGVTNISNSNYS